MLQMQYNNSATLHHICTASAPIQLIQPIFSLARQLKAASAKIADKIAHNEDSVVVRTTLKITPTEAELFKSRRNKTYPLHYLQV